MKVKLIEVVESIFSGGDVPKDRFSETLTDEYTVPIYANAERNGGLYGYTDVARVTVPCVTVAARGTIGFTVKRLHPFLPVVRLITVIPDSKKITLDYLYYALKNYKPKSSGTSIPQLTVPTIMNYAFEMRELNKQKEITLTLDKVENLIELEKLQIKQFDTLIKSRFVEMFGDPVGDSMNWGQKPLGDFLKSIRYGTSTPPRFSESGYAFIRATNVKNGHIVLNDMKYVDQYEAEKIRKCRLQGGELIVVRSGINSGDTCVVTPEYSGQYAGYDMILEFKEEVNPIFVNEMINTEYMNKVVKPLTRRAAQPHLNSEQVQGMPLIQVPKVKQDEFAVFVQQTDKLKVA